MIQNIHLLNITIWKSLQISHMISEVPDSIVAGTKTGNFASSVANSPSLMLRTINNVLLASHENVTVTTTHQKILGNVTLYYFFFFKKKILKKNLFLDKKNK